MNGCYTARRPVVRLGAPRVFATSIFSVRGGFPMKRFVGFLVVLAVLASICLLGVAFSQGQSELANPHKVVHRLRNDNDQDKNRDAHPPEAGRAKPVGDNGIIYHGGPVMLGATHVYYIWYGNW